MYLAFEDRGEPCGREVRESEQEHELQSRHRLHDGNAPQTYRREREEDRDAGERFVGHDEPFQFLRRTVVAVEDSLSVGGNDQKRECTDDIGHARPEEALDKCRLKKNELENDGGPRRKHSREDHIAQRPPREPDVGNERGPDDEKHKCGDERGRKILIEQQKCEVQRDDCRYRTDDGHGVRGVAALQRGVEKEDRCDEGKRGEEREREHGQGRHRYDAKRYEHDDDAGERAHIERIDDGFAEMRLTDEHVFIHQNDERGDELRERREHDPRQHYLQSIRAFCSQTCLYTYAEGLTFRANVA